MSERLVPHTKLWRQSDGHTIVLECVCGHGIDYPGHPDARSTVECPYCGERWTATAPTNVATR